MRIRLATERDINGVLQVLLNAFSAYEDQYPPEAYRNTVLDRAMLTARLKQMMVLIVEDGGRVLGTVSVGRSAPGEVEVRGMGVHPNQLGSGVATILMSGAEAQARAWSCTRITLDTTEVLQRAQRFYERCGYTRTGKVTDFFGIAVHEFEKVL